MGVKDLLLNKGWAGRTISRAETIDRINPVLRELTVLMHTYEAAATALPADAASALAASQRVIRGDLGHLAETVYSAGGVAYTGVDLEPSSFSIEGSRSDIARKLTEAEEHFRASLEGEKKIEHQIRTRAVLENVARSSSDRLRVVRELAHH